MVDEKNLDDQIVVLLVLLRLIRDHDDRARPGDLVVIAVCGQHLLQCFLERDTVEIHGVRLVHIALVVGDIDPRRRADEIENVFQRRVVEVQPDWFARCRIQQRRRVEAARDGSELIDPRLRPRCFDALADLAFEVCHLRLNDSVGANQLERFAILAERAFELILLLELARFLDVAPRGFFLCPRQVDLVFRAVRIVLHRLGEVRDRRIEIARADRLLTAPECPRCGAPGRQKSKQDENREFACHMSVASFRSRLSAVYCPRMGIV